MKSFGDKDMPLPVRKFAGLHTCNEYLMKHADEYRGRSKIEIRKAYRILDPEGNDITMIFELVYGFGCFNKFIQYRVYSNTF